MPALFEKHRPATLAAVVGQCATVAALKTILARDFTGGAFYFIGASGTGKTTLARALVNDLAIDAADMVEIGGADCTVDFVRATQDNFALSTWGESGWKCVIVNESQAMLPRAVQAWLPFLEALPAKRLVIFTSTEALDADIFGNFTAPLASRCKVFTLEPDSEAFAVHVAKIAASENLNGQPIEAYRRLVAECSNNLRMCLQRVEGGEMLRPAGIGIARPVPAVKDTPKQPESRDYGAAGELQARIAAEIAFGAKFLPGSPKFKAHKARLAALESEVRK